MNLVYVNDDESMCYSEDASTLEVSLTLIHRPTGRNTGVTFDNLQTPLSFLFQNQLWPTGERLEEKKPLQFKNGPRELPGLEGTSADGATDQLLLESWRALQGPYVLVIEIDAEDESDLAAFDALDWS